MFKWFHTLSWLLVAMLAGILLAPHVQNIIGGPSPISLQTPEPSHDTQAAEAINSFADSVQLAEPSVVDIYTSIKGRESIYRELQSNLNGLPPENGNSGIGSGVIISESGYIVTSYHVIEEADKILVGLHNNETVMAEIVGSDPETDLAVLKINSESKLRAITIADSDKLRNGDIVLAIGNPFGVGKTATMGIVSATGRNDLGISIFESFIQTDAAINPGNSGGALINTRGELVGINSAIFSRTGSYQGIGFAAPSNQVLKVTDNLIKNGQVIRGWLGVSIHTIFNKETQGTATAVVGLFPNGPAEEAGILPGDVFMAINKEKVGDASSAQDIISSKQPGETIHIDVMRDKEQLSFQATIAQRPKVD